MQVSDKLRQAIEAAPLRHYQLATLAQMHPSTLSKVLNQSARLRPFDRRVLAIARVVGVRPEEAFKVEGTKEAEHGD